MTVVFLSMWFTGGYGFYTKEYKMPTMEICEQLKHRLEFSAIPIVTNTIFIGGSCVEKKDEE